MTSEALADKIAHLAWQKKGLDVTILDLRQLTDVTDFFVIVSGESELHVKAISDFVQEELEKEGIRPWHKEGYQHLNWVLMDFVEVVVHIFKPDFREFYDLERLWGDAKIKRLENDVPN
jgi:ribosome-associated protein